MNYLTEERQNALSSEYVLGSLHGPARIRFQRLLMQHNSMRHTLWRWESRLNELGTALPDVQPAPEVWERIQARLGFTTVPPVTSSNVVSLPQRKPRALQWLAGLSAAAAILMAVLLVNLQPVEPLLPGQIAVVQSEKAQALWLIELREDQLLVTATDKFKALDNQDYELWMVAADGRPPISLGLLPKQGKLSLPRSVLFDQVQVAALAVSLEPLGGSPTGQPTTVLYTAELVAM
ncbi:MULTISPECIES: anti-sigma factor [Cellvibrio]|uniref:Anti-sigma-K factor RskA n=1 Tax=Cellvibrio fibrivorans TaxID=126350 RepID=A0ABU1UUE9_9GAMM|nr:anti-sigma factor [Cellvibrio fibrivorans]MDR7088814.1 anti-sigma-K factor RskA [Cellvibrio fibrivorans]